MLPVLLPGYCSNMLESRSSSRLMPQQFTSYTCCARVQLVGKQQAAGGGHAGAVCRR